MASRDRGVRRARLRPRRQRAFPHAPRTRPWTSSRAGRSPRPARGPRRSSILANERGRPRTSGSPSRRGFRSVEHVKRYTTAGDGHRSGQARQRQRDRHPVGSALPGAGRGWHHELSAAVHPGELRGHRRKGEGRAGVARAAHRADRSDRGGRGGDVRGGGRLPAAELLPARRRERGGSHRARGAGPAGPRPGCTTARRSGSFELHGPDVAAFLNRVYANRWDDLAVGRGRFGWMLREDGRLLDDGITFRLGEGPLVGRSPAPARQVTCTGTSRGCFQLVWPELKVYLTVVTSQWTNVCVCGPKARAVLEGAGTGASPRAGRVPVHGRCGR